MRCALDGTDVGVATGAPQLGHAAALSETCLPHSEQTMSAMVSSGLATDRVAGVYLRRIVASALGTSPRRSLEAESCGV